jgi:serine/threonine protein kinase
VDFGLATVARDTNSLDSTTDERATTARYTSPEVLKNAGRHSKESDVFSFGMVMIEVGDNNFAASQITLFVGEGFHWQSPVQ